MITFMYAKYIHTKIMLNFATFALAILINNSVNVNFAAKYNQVHSMNPLEIRKSRRETLLLRKGDARVIRSAYAPFIQNVTSSLAKSALWKCKRENWRGWDAATYIISTTVSLRCMTCIRILLFLSQSDESGLAQTNTKSYNVDRITLIPPLPPPNTLVLFDRNRRNKKTTQRKSPWSAACH